MQEPKPTPAWTKVEKLAFRFVFVYFILQAVPLSWQFYRDLFSIDWGTFYCRDLFHLSKYAPRFFGPDDTFINWAVVALIALVGTVVWSFRDTARTDYTALFYWLRVVLRYRLAVAVFAYGFIKLFPLLAPLPSIRNLNTPYAFELTGVAGGQRIFYYDADPVNHMLYLQDKYRPGRRGEGGDYEGDASGKRDKKKTEEKTDNWILATARGNIGPEYEKIEPIALTTRRAKGIKSEARQEDGKRKRMILNYQTTDGSRVVLTGINENKDSIYVVLDRINRPYALSKSTLNAGGY